MRGNETYFNLLYPWSHSFISAQSILPWGRLKHRQSCALWVGSLFSMKCSAVAAVMYFHLSTPKHNRDCCIVKKAGRVVLKQVNATVGGAPRGEGKSVPRLFSVGMVDLNWQHVRRQKDYFEVSKPHFGQTVFAAGSAWWFWELAYSAEEGRQARARCGRDWCQARTQRSGSP